MTREINWESSKKEVFRPILRRQNRRLRVLDGADSDHRIQEEAEPSHKRDY